MKRTLIIAGWLAAAAVSAYACHLAVHYPTPIDRALPFLAAVITLAGAPIAVPLLIAAEIAILDETTRLIAMGIIWSAATAVAAFNPRAAARGYRIAIASLLLLRWIPFENVHLVREIFLLLIAIAIVWLLRGTALAVLVAVVVCLITPALPLRTLALPLAVLFALALIRFFHMPRIALTVPSLFALACILTFFAWSGVVARAFPYFTRPPLGDVRRETVNAALAPSRSITIDVPPDATGLIVSGANVAHLRRGAALGMIEPGAIPIRIGDASDWGYMRRDFFYGGHNPLPRLSAGHLRDYGYVAWVDGAGLVPLPNAKTIRVTADASLPANAALQVEGFALR